MEKKDQPVVIIEDDGDDQDIVRVLCEEIGICDTLVFFSNGMDALKYLRSANPKPFIILCDINMPQMNGFQLRREINKDPVLRERSIPFVFFSTAASNQQISNAYDLTVQGFFVKENSFHETKNTLDIIFKYWKKCKRPE
jgi:CheY-like chemotaxis protein